MTAQKRRATENKNKLSVPIKGGKATREQSQHHGEDLQPQMLPLRVLKQTSQRVIETFNSATDIGSPQGSGDEASPVGRTRGQKSPGAVPKPKPPVHTRTIPQLLRIEAANAITMFPALMYAYYRLFHTDLRHAEYYSWSFVLFCGVTCHFPASVAYHIACMKSISLNGGFDTTWFRCFDQTMIHFFSLCATIALSHSWVYGLTVGLIWNVYAIVLLYTRAKTEVRHARMIRQMFSVMLYLTPVALRGHWFLWFQGWFVFISFSMCFVLDEIVFNGWGHPIMHCWLTPYVHVLLTASFT